MVLGEHNTKKENDGIVYHSNMNHINIGFTVNYIDMLCKAFDVVAIFRGQKC